MKTKFDKESSLKILNLFKDNPHMSQREIKREMGVSLGKVNYCIIKLKEKGFLKVKRFKKATKKAKYTYHLTPSGFETLAKLTIYFLKRKIEEYDTIQEEIKELSAQVVQMDYDLCINSNFLQYSKR